MIIPDFIRRAFRRKTKNESTKLTPSEELRDLGQEVSSLTNDTQNLLSLSDSIDSFKKSQGLEIKGGFPIQGNTSNIGGLFEMLQNKSPRMRALSGLINKFKRKEQIKDQIKDNFSIN